MKLSKKSARNIFCLTDQKGDKDGSSAPKSYIMVDVLGQTWPSDMLKERLACHTVAAHLTQHFFSILGMPVTS